MTLFLPMNIPASEAINNYVFGHNETHMVLALDYASITNHHESANAGAIPNRKGVYDINFQVRRGFQCASH